jgi:hypothetical protein
MSESLPFHLLTESDRLQIEQAAAGCIDKTIGDWACLAHALRKLGVILPPGTLAVTVTAICRLAVAGMPPCEVCNGVGRLDCCGQLDCPDCEGLSTKYCPHCS